MKQKLLIKAIYNRKGRFMVSFVSAALGAAIIFILFTLYFDIPNQFSNAFRSYGANIIFVAKDSEQPLTINDLTKVKKSIPEKQLIGIAPYHYETVTLNQQPYLLNLTDIEQVKITNSSWLLEGEWPANKQEIMIGKEVAELSKITLGARVKLQTILDKTDSQTRLKSESFLVSGIVTTGGNEEKELFMNLDGGSQLLGSITTIDLIETSIDGNKEELTQLSEKINKKFPAIEARVANRISDTQDKVLKKIARLFLIVILFAIVLISLILSTTTYALISDRRKEISLKKALGAFESEINKELLFENLLTTFMGCLLGIVLGVFGTKWVSIRMFLKESDLYWQVFFLVFLLLLLISICSTIIPLRNVKKITIEQILRGE